MVLYQLICHLANKNLVSHVNGTSHTPVNATHMYKYNQCELNSELLVKLNKTKKPR